MENVNLLLTAISTVGFPIVCCIAMFVQLNKTNEQHKQEMNNITDALNNNTIALTKLADRLGDKVD